MLDQLDGGELSIAELHPSSSALTSPKNLLYIEANPDIRLVVKVFLEVFSPIRAATVHPENALSLAASYAWDVILLEVASHQGIDLAVYNQLRAHRQTRALPIILLTSRVMPHELAFLERLDISGIIAKPFDSTKLSNQITSLLPLAN